MNPRLSTKRSGVAWIVFRLEQVPVVDEHGHPLPSPWNWRVPLKTERRTVLGKVFAETKDDAQALAEAYYPGIARHKPHVQSETSFLLDREDHAIVVRNRVPPPAKPAKYKRTDHAKTAA